MKTQYKCDVCSRTHDSAEDAISCESKHTVIKFKLIWLIPFVAWFHIPYLLFSKKNAIVTYGNNWIADVIGMWISVGPVLLVLLCFYMSLVS